MTKARILKQEFFIGEDTVVCVITSQINVVANNINFSTNVFKVRGKAVCSPEDTFDIETGRIISESKAFLKLYNKTINLLSGVISQVNTTKEILLKDIEKHEFLYNTEIIQQMDENIKKSVEKRKEAINRRCGKV